MGGGLSGLSLLVFSEGRAVEGLRFRSKQSYRVRVANIDDVAAVEGECVVANAKGAAGKTTDCAAGNSSHLSLDDYTCA